MMESQHELQMVCESQQRVGERKTSSERRTAGIREMDNSHQLATVQVCTVEEDPKERDQFSRM